MEIKRYYWLRLMSNFFELKTTKYLRSLPDGDKLVNVYLHMQLNSLTTNGLLQYDNMFPTIEEELSLSLSEDINALKLLIPALIKINLASVLDDGSIMLLAVQDLIGSETASAQRSREYRAKQNNQKMLQCNNNEIAMQQQREKMKQKPNVEIEIEKEIYKDISKDISCPEKPNSPPLKTKKAQNLKAKVKTIIDYLNAKLNTRYKADNKKTLELINARLKEGFTIDDFKNVIDKKTIEWVNDPSMYKYLRPVTLFSTKFESYLNQPTKKPSNKRVNKFQNFEPRKYDFEEIERLAMED